jgi:radical SAM/Cys-rich protein
VSSSLASGAGFAGALAGAGFELRRIPLQTLQVNVGRRCNQACRHCHVEAAPWRTEMMDQATYAPIAAWIERHRPPVVDITGGAPELSEWFRPLVEVSRRAGCRVIDRNNLTILSEPGFADLPRFLSDHSVEVIASLPCYSVENVRRQRGNGVFERSIEGLRLLNAVGYGTRLPLHLVYNPVGPSLPGPQGELEADYREALRANFGIEFTGLYTITNQPIARFAEDLRSRGELKAYQELLVSAFNPATLEGLMCRSTLSVGYRGEIYDCDFNQMLGLDAGGEPRRLWEITPEDLVGRSIATGSHCFACTAGSGSSCTGALGEGDSGL